MFDEQKVNREVDGKFGVKTGSAPEDVSLAREPELSDYWKDVSDAYGLDGDECKWLAQHLSTVDESQWTTATTSRGIIADALRPHAVGAEARATAARESLEKAVGADIHFDSYQSGEPMMVVESNSKLDYAYMSKGDMEQTVHYVNLMPYGRAESIPGQYRAARRIAESLEEHEDERKAAYDAQYESELLAQRVELFER